MPHKQDTDLVNIPMNNLNHIVTRFFQLSVAKPVDSNSNHQLIILLEHCTNAVYNSNYFRLTSFTLHINFKPA